MRGTTLLAEVLAFGIYVGITKPILTIVIHKDFDRPGAWLENPFSNVQFRRSHFSTPLIVIGHLFLSKSF